MSFLLEKKQEHESGCEAAIRQGDIRGAIFHAAKAAEFAYALAAQTTGSIASRYTEDAEGWLEIGERLKKNPPKGQRPDNGPRPTDKGQRTTDDGQGPEDGRLVTEKPSVTFDMIAGMEEAKATIREMVVYPLQQPDKARSLGLKPGGGVLLYGPPGNGKTTLGKAIAHDLDAAFFYASGAQIRSKWHGESEQKLRKLVQAAKEQPVSVLFLDDVDGLLPKRSGQSVVDNRIVVQFLSEIGGFEENPNTLLLLGATNKPWEIDEAVFRTGRFDEKIYIPPPDRPACLGILKMQLKNVSGSETLNLDTWADRLKGFTGSDIVGIVNSAKRCALSRSIRDNTPAVLTAADIEQSFATIPSSITEKLLKQYDAFREARFG
ncbi:MAG: ATP-binding protein [bacterium]